MKHGGEFNKEALEGVSNAELIALTENKDSLSEENMVDINRELEKRRIAGNLSDEGAATAWLESGDVSGRKINSKQQKAAMNALQNLPSGIDMGVMGDIVSSIDPSKNVQMQFMEQMKNNFKGMSEKEIYSASKQMADVYNSSDSSDAAGKTADTKVAFARAYQSSKALHKNYEKGIADKLGFDLDTEEGKSAVAKIMKRLDGPDKNKEKDLIDLEENLGAKHLAVSKDLYESAGRSAILNYDAAKDGAKSAKEFMSQSGGDVSLMVSSIASTTSEMLHELKTLNQH
jgi:hypothetical protein